MVRGLLYRWPETVNGQVIDRDGSKCAVQAHSWAELSVAMYEWVTTIAEAMP